MLVPLALALPVPVWPQAATGCARHWQPEPANEPATELASEPTSEPALASEPASASLSGTASGAAPRRLGLGLGLGVTRQTLMSRLLVLRSTCESSSLSYEYNFEYY